MKVTWKNIYGEQNGELEGGRCRPGALLLLTLHIQKRKKERPLIQQSDTLEEAGPKHPNL